MDAMMSRMIFAGEKLKNLLELLILNWKERRAKGLSLMEDLMFLLKMAQGREIGGLAAYENK